MRTSIAACAAFSVFSILSASRSEGAEGLLLEPHSRVMIALPDQPSRVEKFAASELAEYLKKSLGIEADEFTGKDIGAKSITFHLATTERSQDAGIDTNSLANDGFVLRANDKNGSREFFIVGKGRRGTLYGVYSLLESAFGARWPEPGDSNEWIPKLDSVDLTEHSRSESPDLPHRTLRIRAPYELTKERLLDFIDWQCKHRMNYLYWHGGFHDYVDRERNLSAFYENDNELLEFVQDRGMIVDYSSHCFRRYFQKRQGPVDMSSQEAEDVMVAAFTDILKRYPFIEYLGLWPGDGWSGWARSDAESCPLDYIEPRKILPEMDFRVPTDSYKIAHTNTYVDFANRVQKRLRERFSAITLTLIAYNKTLLAPDRVRCEPGQQVHTAFRRSYSFPIGDPASDWNRVQSAEFQRWQERCDHVVFYEYYQTGALGSVGRPFPRTIARDLVWLKSVDAGGTASQARSAFFRTLGLNYYTYAKCSWDTNTDVEVLLKDYFRSTYGSAAGTMQDLFDLWESTYNKGGDYFRYDWNVIVGLFTPEIRQRMAVLAKKALDNARYGSDANAIRRCEEMVIVMEAMELFFRHLETKDTRMQKDLVAMNRKYPFVSLHVLALEKAAKMHQSGF